jgi:heptosyltransferase-2
MGDVLLAAAATRELRRAFPEARIDFAVRSAHREAAELLPGVDRVLPFAGSGIHDLLRFRAREARGRADLVVDLHGNFRSRLLAALFPGARVTRYPRLAFRRRALVRWKRGKGAPHPPVWRRYLSALEKAGIPIAADPPRLRVAEANGAAGAIALAPGAGRATKRWPAERFAEAARALSEGTGWPLLLVGSADERPLLEGIRRTAGVEAEILAGAPLAVTAGRLARAALLVTNDSGLLHLASGVGTPVLAIFGPTVPELGFGPPGPRDAVLGADLPCRPCSLHGTAVCPLPDRSHVCMTRIGAEDVVRAAETILRDAPRAPAVG